jgi:hypothetical protein
VLGMEHGISLRFLAGPLCSTKLPLCKSVYSEILFGYK